MAREHVLSGPAVGTRRALSLERGIAIPGFAAFTHALLRIGAAALFMQHGMQKLFGSFGGVGTPTGTVELTSQLGLAGIIEFGGGLLLLLGLFTRPVVVVMAIEMLFAYVTVHIPNGTWPIQNQGELALLYLLIFVFFAAHGAGPFSVDRRIGRHRAPTAE